MQVLDACQVVADGDEVDPLLVARREIGKWPRICSGEVVREVGRLAWPNPLRHDQISLDTVH